MVAPLLAPGFTLVYDMVFVPHPHWTGALLGLSPDYPRTVPTQLLVTTASSVLPGALVQKAILLFVFGGAVIGAARLIDGGTPAARIAAGVLYAWNPLTYERLLIGQWSVLLGYAVLPWAVGAARSFRRRAPGSAARMVLALAALTAASPYAGAVGGATALAVALWPPADADERPSASARSAALRAAPVVLGAVAVSLPWLVPTILHHSARGAAGLSVDLFGARADAPVGTLGSLVSLGGLWRTDLAPPGRSTLIWFPAFALILGLAVVGWRNTGALGWSKGARRGLLSAAAAGLLLAIAPRVPGLHAAVVWVVRTVPGGGFLRDSQKFVIPLALAEAVGFGYGVRALLERIPSTDRLLRGLGCALPLLPLALAPTLAWGAGGGIHTSSYPSSWALVERATSGDPRAGAILVLPWHAYIPFGWNHDQTVHQPAGLYFSSEVVAASSLEFGNASIPGEDPWSRLAEPAVLADGPLAPRLPGLGVGYVLVFKEGDWRPLLAKVAGLDRMVDTPDLALYRGEPPGPMPTFPSAPIAAVVAGDLVALGVLMTAAGGALAQRLRRGSPGS